MKKRIIFVIFLVGVCLSSCGLRERILAPPLEYTVPKDSLMAKCIKGEDHYMFVYKDDGVYQYFINDEEQSEDALDNILENAYIHGSSVENYLFSEFPDSCTITNYENEDK
jgi:hypothetical protein